MNRLAFGLLIVCALGADDDPQDEALKKQREALARIQEYVGSWRGVGQVRRGSTSGAWIEEAEWSWQFDDANVSITFDAPKAKHVRSGTITATDMAGQYALTVKLPDDSQLRYQGQLEDDGRLIFQAQQPAADGPARVTIRMVARGKRMVVLYEQKSEASGRFSRIAEVGYTRRGSNFGQATSYIECVVTGGRGTIAVTHEGKTYYVCCTGCRDYFNEDPAGALAEYRLRMEEEKKKDG